MRRLSVVSICAWKEFLESIRNWWLTGTIILFVLLSMGITGYGVVQRVDSSTIFSMVIASLVNLVIYLVPIMALLLGSTAISGEKEQGTLILLLSQPVTKKEIILGKYLGLAATLTIATLAGFSFTGTLLFLKVGTGGLTDYMIFMGASLALGLIFLSLSMLISVIVKSKAGAAIGAVVTWFLSVFIFDLALIGVYIFASGKEGLSWLSGLIFFNPIDLFRLTNVLYLQEIKGGMGLVGMVPEAFANVGVVVFAFLGWILIPLGVASIVFAKKEL